MVLAWCWRGQVLVLSPTRELALQIVAEVRVTSRSITPPWRSIRVRLALRTYDAPPWGVRVDEPYEVKTNTHPKNITALSREQAKTLLTFHTSQTGE